MDCALIRVVEQRQCSAVQLQASDKCCRGYPYTQGTVLTNNGNARDNAVIKENYTQIIRYILHSALYRIFARHNIVQRVATILRLLRLHIHAYFATLLRVYIHPLRIVYIVLKTLRCPRLAVSAPLYSPHIVTAPAVHYILFPNPLASLPYTAFTVPRCIYISHIADIYI